MRGCIVRRESGNWAIKLTLGKDPETGRYRQQWIGGFRTKKDAERKLTEVLGQVDSGAFVKPAKLTVAEYMRQWLRDYAEPNLRPRTFEGYKAIVERYVIPSPMGRLKLTDLRPTHLQTYEAAMLKSGSLKTKGGGLSPHTVLQHHRLISEALSHAVRLGLLTRNAADGVKAPHFARKEMTPLDPAGVFRFLDACKGTEYHALFHLDIYTGLRRSEALGLRWKDVDLDLATLSVVQVLHRLKDDQSVWLGTKGVKRRQKDVFLEPKTAKGRRQVDLSPAAVLALRAHKERMKAERATRGLRLTPDDLVFAASDGTPPRPDTITHAFKRIARQAGLDGVRLHDLRHTHATLMLRQGVHPKIVQERMGHASIAVTLDIYSHVTPGLQAAAAQRFDEGLARPQPEPDDRGAR